MNKQLLFNLRAEERELFHQLAKRRDLSAVGLLRDLMAREAERQGVDAPKQEFVRLLVEQYGEAAEMTVELRKNGTLDVRLDGEPLALNRRKNPALHAPAGQVALTVGSIGYAVELAVGCVPVTGGTITTPLGSLYGLLHARRALDDELPPDPDAEHIPAEVQKALARGGTLTISGVDPQTGERVSAPFHPTGAEFAAINRARDQDGEHEG